MLTAISKDGTKIAYVREGSGPAVVLVGGALQHKSDQLMKPLLALLAQEFAVVSYDRRGRGESADSDTYEVQREIDDLDAVIKEAGGTAYVFGMSSGGTLALLAAAHLKSIKGVAVYEPPFITEEQSHSNASEYIIGLKKAIQAGQRGKAVKMFMKMVGMPTPLIFIMSLTPMWPKLKAFAPTLVYDALIVDDGTVPKEVLLVTAPTLVITGDAERMKDAAKKVLEVLPNAQHQVLKGQTHNVKPSVLAPAVSKFFKALS